MIYLFQIPSFHSHVRLPVGSFLQVKESMSAAGAAYADAEASWRLPRFFFSIVGRAVMAVARKPKSKPLRRRRTSLPPRRKLLKRHRLELQGSWTGQGSRFFLLKVGTKWNDSSINQQRVSILLGKSIQRVSTPQNPSMKWDAIMEMGVIHMGFVWE